MQARERERKRRAHFCGEKNYVENKRDVFSANRMSDRWRVRNKMREERERLLHYYTAEIDGISWTKQSHWPPRKMNLEKGKGGISSIHFRLLDLVFPSQNWLSLSAWWCWTITIAISDTRSRSNKLRHAVTKEQFPLSLLSLSLFRPLIGKGRPHGAGVGGEQKGERNLEMLLLPYIGSNILFTPFWISPFPYPWLKSIFCTETPSPSAFV